MTVNQITIPKVLQAAQYTFAGMLELYWLQYGPITEGTKQNQIESLWGFSISVCLSVCVLGQIKGIYRALLSLPQSASQNNELYKLNHYNHEKTQLNKCIIKSETEAKACASVECMCVWVPVYSHTFTVDVTVLIQEKYWVNSCTYYDVNIWQLPRTLHCWRLLATDNINKDKLLNYNKVIMWQNVWKHPT